ncbi:hypothetical protein [Roseivirga sp.]|uniref:hypothetical protein n=1 Tax=Roseivirga sp. TaxID=1964215 RepID=UPI003B8D79A7
MEKSTSSNPAKISPKRLKYFKFLSLGFGLFFALFVGELVARLNYFGIDALSYTKVNSFVSIGVSGFLTKANNGKVLYELKPNIDAYFKLKKFTTNRHGQRDKEYSLIKPEKTIRGIVLGDSFTMASGVDIEDAYHSVVEKSLNETDGDVQFELINMGVGGYNLLNYLGLLEDKVLRYNPDFIIIGYCAFNDYFLPAQQHYEGDFSVKVKKKGRKPFFSFYLGGMIERTFASSRNKSRMFELGPEQKVFMQDMFRQFQTFSQVNDIPVVISVLSVLPDNGNMEIVQEIADQYHIPITNSLGEIPPKKLSSYVISKLDHHPNAKAHKIYADNLLNFPKFQEVIQEQKEELYFKSTQEIKGNRP